MPSAPARARPAFQTPKLGGRLRPGKWHGAATSPPSGEHRTGHVSLGGTGPEGGAGTARGGRAWGPEVEVRGHSEGRRAVEGPRLGGRWRVCVVGVAFGGTWRLHQAPVQLHPHLMCGPCHSPQPSPGRRFCISSTQQAEHSCLNCEQLRNRVSRTVTEALSARMEESHAEAGDKRTEGTGKRGRLRTRLNSTGSSREPVLERAPGRSLQHQGCQGGASGHRPGSGSAQTLL